MTTMDAPTSERPWYEDTADCEGGWLRIRETMQEIARHSVLDGDEPVWAAYSEHVKQSLSQELYGEYLSEGGWDSLHFGWDAFRDGWLSGAGQYAGEVRWLERALHAANGNAAGAGA